MEIALGDGAVVTEDIGFFLLRPDHVGPEYLSWMQDTKVQTFLESRFTTHTRDSLRAFVAQALDDPDTLMLGISMNGQHVGNIKLGPINRHHQTGDIGIMIGHPQAWGKGVARAAITGLCALARDTLGLRKVTAGASSANHGSIRAFQAAGFSIEGRRTAQLLGQDGPEDLVLMGLVLSS